MKKNPYPKVTAMLGELSRANGMSGVDPAPLFKWLGKMPEMERAVGKLSEDERLVLVDGDPAEQRALARRHSSIRTLHRFLESVFKSWNKPW